MDRRRLAPKTNEAGSFCERMICFFFFFFAEKLSQRVVTK